MGANPCPHPSPRPSPRTSSPAGCRPTTAPPPTITCPSTTAYRSHIRFGVVSQANHAPRHTHSYPFTPIAPPPIAPPHRQPDDAAGNTNQRRDQSVLNAVLCARANGRLRRGGAGGLEGGAGGIGGEGPVELKCHRARGWWAWAGQETFNPPESEYGWDEHMTLFSRRAMLPKPYAGHILSY